MKPRAILFASVPILGIAIGYLSAGQIPVTVAEAREHQPLIQISAAFDPDAVKAGEGGSASPVAPETADRPATFDEELQGLRVFAEPVEGDGRLAGVLKMGRFSAKVEGRNGPVEVVADIAIEFQNPGDARMAYSMNGIMAVRDHVLFSLVAASGIGPVHDSKFDPVVLNEAMMRLLREKDPRIKTVHFVKLTTRAAS